MSRTTLISIYVQNDHSDKVLELFCEMQKVGFKLDKFTFNSVLSMYDSLKALDLGKQVHTRLIVIRIESNVVVGRGLVDMYAKNGRIDGEQQGFDRMVEHNVVYWTAILAGYY